MTISKSAEIKNSHLDSNDIDIDDGAKLIDVHMKARKIILKSNATLTNCKLFSDGIITIGEKTTC